MIKVLLIIIFFQFLRIGKTFKINWTYSQLGIPDLNSPECGLNFEPIVSELSFEDKCYKNRYNKTTFLGFDRYLEKIDSPKERVFRGQDSQLGESAFVVYVRPRKEKSFWQKMFSWSKWETTSCTGVLITFEWVLTAAHCFLDWSNDIEYGIHVSAGGNRRKGVQSLEMYKHFAHPTYIDPSLPNSTLTGEKLEEAIKLNKMIHDIALIKLISKFKRQSNNEKLYLVNTICLPEKANLFSKDTDIATYFGFGDINLERQEPTFLQKGNITLQKYYRCNRHSFCGHFSNTDAILCQGDSGGPLIQYTDKRQIRALLIAITRSVAPGSGTKLRCDNTMIAATFTAIPDKHIDWILKIMSNN